MKKGLKQFLRGALAVMAVGAILAGGVAEAAKPAIPRDANGTPYQNPGFIGLQKCNVYPGLGGAGTGGFACPGTNTGGFVYAAYVYGSALAANAFADLWDTATASDVSGMSWGNSRLSPQIFGTSTPYGGNSNASPWPPGFVPPWPVRFDSQLVWNRSDGSVGIVIYYRLDAGTNP